MVTAKRPRVDFLPSTGLHEELELWYKQWPLAPICLLGECRRIWVSLSWFSNLPYWLKFWFLFGAGADYLPSPSRKDTGRGVGGQVKHPGHTHSWSRQWVGLGWKIWRNPHPVKRYRVRGWLKDARRIAHPVEGCWVGGLNWEKNQEMPRAWLKDAEVTPLYGTELSWLSG